MRFSNALLAHVSCFFSGCQWFPGDTDVTVVVEKGGDGKGTVGGGRARREGGVENVMNSDSECLQGITRAAKHRHCTL